MTSIPLLSKKPFAEFSPEDFKAHVHGLYFRPPPKKSAPKKKQLKDLKVRVKRKKDGSLSVVTKRSPKYVSEDEMKEISQAMEIPLNELFIGLREKGLQVMSHEQAAQR